MSKLKTLEEKYQINTKYIILIIVALIIVFTLVITYWVLDDQRAVRTNLNAEFSGTIDNVSYDLKDYPTIIINGKSYYIGGCYDTEHQIEVGDSIIKKKGSEVYKLIKHKSNNVIEFRIE